MESRSSRWSALALVTTVALLGALATPSPALAAQATPPEVTPESPSGDYLHNFNDFYTHPPMANAKPGIVLKTQRFKGRMPYKNGDRMGQPVTGSRIMYATTASNGKIVPATGAIIDPSKKWEGKGETPLVIFAPATLGQGPQCGASRSVGALLGISPAATLKNQGAQTLSLVTNYENFTIFSLLEQGFKVFVVDYVGSTEGPQSYIDNIEAGHAMLDAARAATNVNYTQTSTPVGFFGYSQGGSASALGSTLHKIYAPDVNLTTSYIGGPALDLKEVLKLIDGTMITAAALYALNGINARYPEAAAYTENLANEKGRKLLEKVKDQCIADSILSAAFVKTESLTKDGKPFSYHANQPNILKKLLTVQLREAMRKPSVPALVVANPYDDIVGYPQMAAGAKTWCAKGAKIKFVRFIVKSDVKGMAISHLVPTFTAVPLAIDYMVDAFNGKLPTKCTVSTVE